MEQEDKIINRIQITNVGGQTLPVIQGILEFPCSLNILLHSNESAPTAQKIADLMGDNCQLHLINDANDFDGIVSFIDQIVSEYQQSGFFINVAGGTKIMTLALYTFFINSSLNSTIFHVDQNGMIHYLRDMKTEPLKATLPIEKFIEFSGQKIKSLTRVADIEEDLFETAKQVRKLHDTNNFDFTYLLNCYRELRRKEGNFEDFELINHKSYSCLRWSGEDNELTLSLDNKYTNGYDEYTFIGRKNIGIVLETKWFELELVNIFHHWDKTRDLAWSVVVPYIEGSDKNEIDIIVNLGNKLLFVECKTQVHDIKDIDKLRNAAKTYGGLGSKAILITYYSPNKRTIEKCNDNNIILFSFTNPDKSRNNSDDLYLLLNNEISKSNTF